MASPPSTPPQGGPRCSLSKYDGRRVLNTPVSLAACRAEGVHPQSLVLPELLPRVAKPELDPFVAVRPASNEEAAIQQAFLSRRREALLQQVSARYAKLQKSLAAGHSLPSAASSPTRQAGRDADAPSTGAVPPSPASPGAPVPPKTAPSGSTSPRLRRNKYGYVSVVLPDGEGDPVAQYFLTLKHDADAYVGRVAKWTKKEHCIADRTQSVEKQRSAKADALHSTQESKAQKALKTFEKTQEEFRAHVTQSVSRSAVRSEQHKIAHTQQKKASSRKKRGGSAEREAASRLNEDRIEAIRQKLSKGDAAAAKRAAEAAAEQKLREFEHNLHVLAHDDACRRADRARSNRKEDMEAKLSAAAAIQRQKEEEDQRRLMERALIREAVERQKFELAKYVDQVKQDGAIAATRTGNTVPVLPPPWLQDRVKKEEKRVAADRASGSLSARGAGRSSVSPTRSESPGRRQPAPPLTERARPPNGLSLQARERFTIAQVENPARAYPRWMYQS